MLQQPTTLVAAPLSTNQKLTTMLQAFHLPHLLLLCSLASTNLKFTHAATASQQAFETATTALPLDGRIIGGWEAAIDYFPYQVSLQSGARHICGAAIINAWTIITAAHCVLEYTQPELYSIRAGSSQHNVGGVLMQVRRIVPHEYFNRPTPLNNDIALLILTAPLEFSRSIQPIRLATPADFISAQAVLYVSGWGAKSAELMQTQTRLRFTQIAQIDRKYCALAYLGATTLTNTMFCAGSQLGAHDSCQGDSGGPVVTTVNGPTMKLCGIVSWGLSCGNAQYPGVYTRITAYGDWVANTLRTLQF